MAGHIDTSPRTDAELRAALLMLPRYRLILHNDDHNTMGGVVRRLRFILPALTLRRAVGIMLTAHLRGVAEVTICPRELAEHYRERLRRHGLTASIESE
jgi:ATP-dependent Clp protease adaptor protein ClpS